MQPPLIVRRFGLLDGFSALPIRDRAVIAGSLIAACMFFLDPAVLGLARGLDPNVRAAFQSVTDIGKSGWILALTGSAVLICLALAMRARHRRLMLGRLYVGQAAAFVFVSVAATGLGVSLVKNTIGRARPKLFDTLGSFHFSPFAFHADFASFPSGHATTIFALATALALIWPAARVPLYTVAVWIGLSRVLTGAHYLSDVAAGAAFGTIGTLMIRDCFARRRVLFRPHRAGCCLRGARIKDWVEQRLPGAVVASVALRLERLSWESAVPPLRLELPADGDPGHHPWNHEPWEKAILPLDPLKPAHALMRREARLAPAQV